MFTESRDEMGDLDLPDADLLRAKLSEVGRVPYEYPYEYPGANLSEVPRPAGSLRRRVRLGQQDSIGESPQPAGCFEC